MNTTSNMKAPSNISLKVPYNEKELAKSLGARWNAEAKHWYVPQGVDVAPFEKWFTGSPVPVQSAVTPPAASKPTTKDANSSAFNQPDEDDLDAINAQLRDAYEPR